MEKKYVKNVLDKVDELCQDKYKTTLYNKLEMKIDDVDDLATVLASNDIDKVMSSGRIEFSKLMSNIGVAIAASLIGPVSLAVAAYMMMEPNKKEKSNRYRDIVKQLYSNSILYRAFKNLPTTELSVDDSANHIFSELSLSFGEPA